MTKATVFQPGRVVRGLLSAVGVLVAGCGAFQPPLPVVSFVDIERYTGQWYEIARYPNRFEQGCVGVTADYAVLDDGRIEVINTCREGTLDGPVRTIEGRARVVDLETNAKLKVAFFGPFEGDYWILELADDYRYAVVGEPRRRFLWILSRTPTMTDEDFDAIIATLPEKGYDPERLIIVPQPAS